PAHDVAQVEVLISTQVTAKGTADGHIQPVARRSGYTAPVSREPTLGNVRSSFGRRHCRQNQIIADHVETDAFGRAGGNIGVLARADEGILHIWLSLRTASAAQPIPEIETRVLIEVDDVGSSTVDRKIAHAGHSEVSLAGGRPTEQVLGPQIAAT